MKTFQMMTLALLLAAFGACTNDNEDNSPSDTPTVLSDGGAWRVSYYFDKDEDETADFAGYRFSFQNDGVLEASRDGSATTGTWKVVNDDGVEKLVIDAGTAAKPLSDLTDDWVIVEQSASRIRLEDDNDEHVEELHFERI